MFVPEYGSLLRIRRVSLQQVISLLAEQVPRSGDVTLSDQKVEIATIPKSLFEKGQAKGKTAQLIRIVVCR